jgi:hypothetical protein
MLWKLAWFRCLLYAFAGMWSEFEHLTETWSQTTWHDTGTFELVRLFGHCLFTGGIVTILAFLDQTLSKSKAVPVDETDPAILRKTDTETKTGI